MSVHSGKEVEGEVEGEAVLPEAEGEGEGSLQTLNDADVEGSEDVSSSYVSGETDSEEIPRTQQGSEIVQLDVIREQSTPSPLPTDDDAAAVAKGEDVETVETEEQQEVPSQEEIPGSEACKEEEILSEKQDEFEHEYITPIEDPYQKALKYFAKHGILELFGDITALIVLRRPDNPYELMANEIAKIQEIELLKGHVTLSEHPYIPPKKTPSATSKSGRTSASSDKRDDVRTTESKEMLNLTVQQQGSSIELAEHSEGFDLKDELNLGLIDEELPENVLGVSDDNDTAIVRDDTDDVGSFGTEKGSHDSQVKGDHAGTDRDREEHRREHSKVNEPEMDTSTEHELVVKKEKSPDSPASSVAGEEAAGNETVTENETNDERSDAEDPVSGK